ncbi:MAG: PAS domain-containing protein [Pseudomonadota bacterium]
MTALGNVVHFNLRLTARGLGWRRAADVWRIEKEMMAGLSGSNTEIPSSLAVDAGSAGFLSKLADLVPGIVYVFNHQTMSNEYANRSVGELLGYTVEEVQQMGDELLPTIVHPDDFELLALHVAGLQSLADGERAVLEYRTIHRTGRQVWLRSIESVYTRAADGSVLRHIGIALDITSEKSAEQTVGALRAELEACRAESARTNPGQGTNKG